VFFLYTIISRILMLAIPVLLFSACIDDGPLDVDESASLTVSIAATPSSLTEVEQTVLTLTIELSEIPPEEGVDVTVNSDMPGSLAEFDVFAAMFNGATLVTANADSSGFTLNVFEQTATVSLPVFNDGVAEGPETLTYALEPSADYAIDPAASAVSVTLFDVAL
jgi:hypothetical protein